MSGSYFALLKILLILVTLSGKSTKDLESSIKYRGDDCILKDQEYLPATCTHIEECSYAMRLLKRGLGKPQLCGEFVGKFPVVCCPEKNAISKTCVSYKNNRMKRQAVETTTTTIAHGEESDPQEFPHMAVLGYGKEENIQWICGGSLINEQYILTAAHCKYSLNVGPVKWVRLGDLNLYSNKDDAKPQEFTVVQAIAHPSYKPPSQYHDIALLKLNQSVTFTDYVYPACLYIGEPFPADFGLTATGWGKTEFLGEQSDHLMKADLVIISNKTCNDHYSSTSKRKLSDGILDKIQLCAGHPLGRDTCPGDSGGPLEYQEGGPNGDYVIVGITSFGKACGLENSTGVYVRVSYYVDWIEDIIWPPK